LIRNLETLYQKEKITKQELADVAKTLTTGRGVDLFNIPNEVKKSFKKNSYQKDEEGKIKLAPVFKDLKEKYSYEDLRWYRIVL
jgi:hypothetical protein